jgi:hypothetical protein
VSCVVHEAIGARRLAAVSVLLLSIVTTAGASTTVDAKTLVLQPSDVPRGFEAEGRGGYVSNAALADGREVLRKLVVRSRRVTGYRMTFDKRVSGTRQTILSRSHLCETVPGAHALFAFADSEQRALNAARIARGGRVFGMRRGVLGHDSSLYWARTRPYYALVLWRTSRVVAALSTWGLRPEPTLDLARLQQSRIDRALR